MAMNSTPAPARLQDADAGALLPSEERSTSKIPASVVQLARAPRATALRAILSRVNDPVDSRGDDGAADAGSNLVPPASCDLVTGAAQTGTDPTAEPAPALSMRARLTIRIAPRELCARHLDPEAAFILGLLDGHTTVEAVLKICPLAAHETLRHIAELMAAGVIGPDEEVNAAS
jgi:hypothetical protein